MPIDLKRPVPLYLQIAEDISARVASGELRTGEMHRTIRGLPELPRVLEEFTP